LLRTPRFQDGSNVRPHVSTALFVPVVALAAGLALFAGGPAAADPPGHAPPGHGRSAHARHYPPRGHVVRVLPPGHRVAHHHHSRYYYYGGVWYRPYGAYYRVIAPPIGVAVSFLPDFHVTFWYGGVPYYYANSVYYVQRAGAPGYVVSEAPPGVAGADGPVVRHECHRWAVSRNASGRSEYRRAISACLEASGHPER
jgi:hypothetical protein